jgi:hypothetical protein
MRWGQEAELTFSFLVVSLFFFPRCFYSTGPTPKGLEPSNITIMLRPLVSGHFENLIVA